MLNKNTSFNNKKGTFRGMHYQDSPYDEDKLVRCTKGAIFDVIVDLRPSSSTYKQWMLFQKSAKNIEIEKVKVSTSCKL